MIELGRRVWRTSRLLITARASVRRDYPEGPGLRDPEGRAARLRMLAARLCSLHGLELRVRGRVPQGRFVLVSNHVSYMDPVTLCSLVACVAIAKQEVASWPVIGETLRTLGVMMVAREDAHSGARVLRQTMRMLASGLPVLAFPEGTTSPGDRILPLRRGLFGAARIVDVPVVPVAIRYDAPTMAWIGNASFVPHYLRNSLRHTTKVGVNFGDPIGPDASPTAEGLARLARERLIVLLDELGGTEANRPGESLTDPMR